MVRKRKRKKKTNQSQKQRLTESVAVVNEEAPASKSWEEMTDQEKVVEVNKGCDWPEGTSLEDINILIGTPHSYPMIHKEWFAMYERLQKPKTCRLYMDPSLPLSDNRNNCVLEAQESGADFLMFIDHDNILDPDMLVRLIQYNVPICGALYYERKYPHLPVAYTFENDYQTVRVMYEYEKGVTKLHVTGLGCTLIDMRVFDIIPEPWFCYEYKGHTWGTEDIGFYHKVHDYGIDVFMDTKNTVGHLTESVIDEGDWLHCKDGYLAEVNRKAKEFGSNAVYVDKRKNQILPSPSHANSSVTGGK